MSRWRFGVAPLYSLVPATCHSRKECPKRSSDIAHNSGSMRRLFAIISSLSFVLCIGSCTLWFLLALHPNFYANMHAMGGRWGMTPRFGALYLDFIPVKQAISGTRMPQAMHPSSRSWSAPGIHWSGRVSTFHNAKSHEWFIFRYYCVHLQFWLPTTITGIAPAFFALQWLNGRWRGARLLRLGLCSRCGYDISQTQSRCPECGVEPRGRNRRQHAADV